LREPFGAGPAPDNDDTRKVDAVFQKSLQELRTAGATLVDPLVIPELKEYLAKRTADKYVIDNESNRIWLERNPNSRYQTPEDVLNSPDYSKLPANKTAEWKKPKQAPPEVQAAYYAYIEARERLRIIIMDLMAENNLDAFVYKSVEFQPPRINDELGPNYRSQGRVPTLNTYLGFASVVTVPAGLTSDGLPAGLTFFGRPYDEPRLLRLAYAYEQATKHRVPPKTTPPLSSVSSGR
jgi:Asp-tRNA(Asn)/Glu-tRNA(Gln) amidotransferase A subunit family amidase